jgi:glycine/D-amino acid oxidase-like deaminating enzyme
MSIWLQKELPSKTQVVVIGGGIAGVSVAYHLAANEVDVVLLEAGEIACRATGRNDGQLLIGTGEPYNRVVSQFGPDGARKILKLVLDNNYGLKHVINTRAPQARLATGGGWHLAQSKNELEELTESARLLEMEGVQSIMVDAEHVSQLFPVEHFYGALHLPDEGIVNPVELTYGLMSWARGNGAKFYPHHKVKRVLPRGNEHVVHLENGKSIQAAIVVNCTSALNLELDESGYLKENIFPYRGQIIASDPIDSRLIDRFFCHAMSSNFGYEYFRTYQNRFLIGGMRWSMKGQQEGTIDDTKVASGITSNLYHYVHRHLPTLKDVSFPHVWSGIMAGTKDGLPIVGEIPGQPGVFTLVAFNGYGLSFAFKAAELICDYVLEGRSDHAAAPMLSPRRFK